jgi:hypothetical protein
MSEPVVVPQPVEFSPTPEIDKKHRVDDEKLNEIFALLGQTLERKEEDVEQVSFVTALQKNRQFLLQYAMRAYMEKPGSASLLEGVTSLLGHMEKAVRDDRKERAKKQENQDNVVSFRQMIEAMSMIKTGALVLPTFDVTSFMPDPNVSLVAHLDVKPINDEELVQGNAVVDIDGNPV